MKYEKKKTASVQSQEFEKAASFRDTEQKIKRGARKNEEDMERKTGSRK